MAGKGWLPLVVLVSGLLLIGSASTSALASGHRSPNLAGLRVADWPQLAYDGQRTGASPQGVHGPYRFYWRWMEVPFASRAQPVVADGRLFIGGLDGVMYALDAAHDAQGGAPRVLWRRDLYSPIRSGAGVDGDTVVVGTHHGAVYGLEATSGRVRWSAHTGGAILAAPLISSGTAYLGSAGGEFYAVRTSDGAVVWRRPLGAPVLGSAALGADRQRVFFLAENVTAYALAAGTGEILWRTQLQGQSGADRWPVVLGDLVVFRTMPIRRFGDLLRSNDDVLDAAGPRRPDWAADWTAVRSRILQHLAEEPADQTFFALSVATGKPLGVAPALYTFGNNDPPSPPVAHGQALYLPYRARHGIQTDSAVAVHVTTRYDAELGRMDPSTLDITGLRSPDTFRYQFRLTSDEPGVLTLAGDLLLVDNWDRLGGIRLTDGALVGVAQAAYDSPCYSQLTPNADLMPFYEGCPWPGPSVGEGHARTGAVAASGRIFWQVGGSGLASIGPADGRAGSRPALGPTLPAAKPALPAPTTVSPDVLRSFIWTEPPRPIAAPADLRRRLEEEIGRIVASDEHLLPFYLERGFHGRGSWPPDVTNDDEPTVVADSNAFWFDPGELVLTLSTAYPYLTPELQARVRSYLQVEMARFPPLERLPYPAAGWLTQGRAREPYPVPIRNPSWSAWPPPGVPIQTLYALWAYARYTGDWQYLSERWSAIQSLFEAKKGAIDSYAEVAGAIGYARIARQLGYTSEARAGETTAVAAMQGGLDFAGWLDRANRLYPPDHDRPLEKPGRRAPVFFGLTPEVGRYLRATNLAAVEQTLEDVAGYPDGSYLWYATRLGLQAELGESSYHGPEIGWSVFLAQAYVREARQAQLRRWLDRPWGLGDVWYLQKLIATIEAPVDAPFSVGVYPVLR